MPTPTKNKSKKVRPAAYPTDGLATPGEACEFLGCARSSLRTWCQKGMVEFILLGAHHRFAWEYLHQVKRGEKKIGAKK